MEELDPCLSRAVRSRGSDPDYAAGHYSFSVSGCCQDQDASGPQASNIGADPCSLIRAIDRGRLA
jgi:hypothetical protein